MAARDIKRSEAETFVHGLKFAAKLIAEIPQAKANPFAAFAELDQFNPAIAGSDSAPAS